MSHSGELFLHDIADSSNLRSRYLAGESPLTVRWQKGCQEKSVERVIPVFLLPDDWM